MGSLSFGLFVCGVALLFASVLTAVTEGMSRHKQPWIPVLMLAVSALIPFISPDVDFPGDNRNWLITHLVFIAILMSAQFFTLELIATLLRAGLIASVATLLGGAQALAVDERSLFVLDGRLRGVFGHANMTGLVAVATLLLALGATKWRKFDLVLSVCVVLAAMSLTSLAAACIGLAAWLVRARAARLAVLVLGLISLFVPMILVLTMGSRLDPQLFTGRSGTWQWALSLDFDRFTGLGTGLFETLGAGKFVPWFHAHNQVIMDYVTGGWPLATATVLLLASIGAWAVSAHDPRQLVLWCVLVLQCLTEVPLILNYPSGGMLSTAIIVVVILQVPSIKPSALNGIESTKTLSGSLLRG
ncbi:hypothetical protein [Paenarthrobacter nitroguajacolicus]|uniref:hypothetical protein n=1 Tax=Paenarthrobacter nitroguajacolicus TaxID=211146 RepID=UPI003AF37763